MGKLPAIFLYDGDWLKDGVSGCTLAAQGLWLRMMFIGHNSERYGYLCQNGMPIPSESIARRCGCTPEQYISLLAELDAAAVPSRTPDGIIYSRRMVRDAQNREAEKNKKRKQRARDSVPDSVPPIVPRLSVIEIEDEPNKKEKPLDELVFKVLAGLSLSSSNPLLLTAVGEALQLKGAEPNWTLDKAALHFIERGSAYKTSGVWNTEFKKSWVNWFNDQCYDQDPSAWKRKKHITESGQKIDRGYIPLPKREPN